MIAELLGLDEDEREPSGEEDKMRPCSHKCDKTKCQHGEAAASGSEIAECCKVGVSSARSRPKQSKDQAGEENAYKLIIRWG